MIINPRFLPPTLIIWRIGAIPPRVHIVFIIIEIFQISVYVFNINFTFIWFSLGKDCMENFG